MTNELGLMELIVGASGLVQAVMLIYELKAQIQAEMPGLNWLQTIRASLKFALAIKTL